jgi:fucose permease
VGYAVAPALGFMAAAAVLAGLGAGAIDSGLNAYAAEEFGPRHMNWLHAAFGVGATVGPLVMTAVLALGLSWRWGFAVVAVAQAVLAVAFMLTAGMWTRHHEATTSASSATAVDLIDAPGLVVAAADPVRPPARDTLRLPSLWWGATAFALYTAMELSTGLWAFLLLTEGRGLSTGVAGVCVAGYWASLTVGRVLVGWVGGTSAAPRHRRVDRGARRRCRARGDPGARVVAVVGRSGRGPSAAPVFPMMTLTTSDRVGDDLAARAIGIQIGAASVGAALIPAAIGVVLARTSPDALGLLLLALALALAAVYALAQRSSSAAPG